MTTETTDGFAEDFGRDLESALWTLPDGERVLCCEGRAGGFVLHDRQSWNNAAVSIWEADAEGHVTRLGGYVDYDNPAWIVPADVREAAIS